MVFRKCRSDHWVSGASIPFGSLDRVKEARLTVKVSFPLLEELAVTVLSTLLCFSHATVVAQLRSVPFIINVFHLIS
jgi:hypothetical protein